MGFDLNSAINDGIDKDRFGQGDWEPYRNGGKGPHRLSVNAQGHRDAPVIENCVWNDNGQIRPTGAANGGLSGSCRKCLRPTHKEFKADKLFCWCQDKGNRHLLSWADPSKYTSEY